MCPRQYTVSLKLGSWRDHLPALARMWRAVRLVWTSGPGWTAASIALVLVQSILPLVQLYLLKLMVDAVATRDLPLIQTCAMIFCLGYLALITAADIVAILSNPRLRK